MRTTTRMALGAVVAAGVLAAGRARATRRSGARLGGTARGGRGRRDRVWHVLTVSRSPDQVAPRGQLPEPLAALGESVEVRLREAPGDRGTEIAVRLRDGEPAGLGAVAARLRGNDPRWAVRRALREARCLLETGEVLHASRPSTTERTLLSRPLAYATRHGREEGLL